MKATGKLLKVFSIFASISAVTIGGGYAMIPVIREYVVKRHAIVTESEFLEAVARAQSVPGAIAVNLALILGSKIAGISGAITALFGVVIPPFIIMIMIASLFKNIISVDAFSGFLYGIRAGVTAILVYLSYLLILSKFKKMKVLVSLLIITLFVLVLKISLFWTVLITTVVVYVIQGEKND
ncbi:chromate transporter [Kosmotoga pacifica]|uniref:Chromate transporter n=2 Tax=Kosmotoga pacifica TaxID=1330330 RepID=A0A0G2ZFG9_9BACT|nr:chromate transporter [Kosmotoga pacifica]AKI98299.1 hypothetical protein IX53_06065 [Kosmotoga pacifica]